MLQSTVARKPQVQAANANIRIVVRTLAGESKVFLCHTGTTVDLVKEHICISMGHPKHIQKLTLEDTALQDGNRTLMDLNMTNGTVLTLDVDNASQVDAASIAITVTVETLAGESKAFLCPPQLTVALLKDKIYESMGHPQFIQKLILIDKPLEDGNETLMDLNVQDGSIVTLVLDAQALQAAEAEILFSEKTILHNHAFSMRQFVASQVGREDSELREGRAVALSCLFQKVTEIEHWLYNGELTLEEIRSRGKELNELFNDCQ